MDKFIQSLQQNRRKIEEEDVSFSDNTVVSLARRNGYVYLGMTFQKTLGVPDLYSVLIGREGRYNSEIENFFTRLVGYEQVPMDFLISGKRVPGILIGKQYESSGGVAFQRPKPREVIVASPVGHRANSRRVPYDGNPVLWVAHGSGMKIMELYLDTSPAHLGVINDISEVCGMKPKLVAPQKKPEPTSEMERFEGLLGNLDINL